MRTLPQALGSNAGASFASKSKDRAALTGMGAANPTLSASFIKTARSTLRAVLCLRSALSTERVG
jgi:hypothetical protein